MNKRFKCSIKTAIFSLLIFCLNVAQAQEDGASVKEAVQSKQFVFEAQTVQPATGSFRQLTGERYEVRLAGDSLVSYLPYFGRVYSAPLNARGGIQFTSTKFQYAYKQKKKGDWSVSIKPSDVTDLREFVLTVNENGFATLQALSNNRQPISYNGQVRTSKQPA